MKFYKTSVAAFILLSVILILIYANNTTAEEKPATTAPAEVKSSPATVTPSAPKETAPVPAAPQPVKVKRNSIGCVLPLSGKYADWGNKALDAIMLAAGMSGRDNKTPWEVLAEDSQGTPEKTKTAIARLANDKNVMAIIAVSETAEALEAANEAQKLKVPLLLITSREGITSAGEYVFQNFLTPTQQIRTLVKYAMDDLNCAIFAVMYPQDDYGEEMVKIFRREVVSNGGKVEKSIPYAQKQTDFAAEINKLTGRIVKAPSKSKANKDEEQEQTPLDFEVLFIPDSYLRAKMIAAQFDFYNIKGFTLLGTSLWNTPALLKNGADYMEGATFVDSFFKDGSFTETFTFVDDYHAAYKRDPENIEALAFDTAGMIFTILGNEKIKTRQEFAAGLAKIGIYNGATGSTYFDANRVAQKTPFILRVEAGKLEQVK